MTSDQWARVKEIFQQALDFPPTERPGFLLSACSGDHALLTEVESLLASSDDSSEFLSDNASAYVPSALQHFEDNNIGRRVGPYQLIQEIGAGGMGAVYLAERIDEFRQKTALKLTRPGMDSRAFVSRFRFERQILSGLDHPHIARLLDGGATEDGLPYFVMEYVEGQPIDDWCRLQSANVDVRLRLFLQVCDAVQYAHRNLVVHRDLKPGNILVTPDGVPKLLDFGIAKLLHSEDGQDSAALTQVGMRLMTPEYASPEQARGLQVSTATDVYSLGVILYELLTEKAPYEFATRSAVDIERTICEQDPSPPSRLAAAARKQSLAGDLDAIVLKALEKNPERRYASVEGFAEDIRRHLASLPIQARPQTWRYQMGRFARRNRGPVLAAALALLSLSAGLVTAMWQAGIARRQSIRAERNFDDLRHLTQRFLFDIHDAIKTLPGSTRARNVVLQTAVDYLRRLSQQTDQDPSLAREVAEAWLRLGDVQGNPYGANKGDAKAALSSYEEALAVAQKLVLSNKQDFDSRRYLARAHRSVGELIPILGDIAGAVPHFRAAINALDGMADPESRLEVARSYESLGDVLGHPGIANLNDPAGARNAYNQSLTLRASKDSNRSTAVLRMKLGDLDLNDGNAPRAIENYRASANAFSHSTDSGPSSRESATIHRKIGEALEELGQPQNALAEYQQAKRISRELIQLDPANQQVRGDYIVVTKTIADLFDKQGQHQRALPLYREVLDLISPSYRAQPENLLLASRYADMLLTIGILTAKQGDSSSARQLYAEGLKIYYSIATGKDATAEQIDDYVSAQLDCPLSQLYVPAETLAFARKAADKSKGSVPRLLEHLADAYYRAGNAKEAATAQQKALSQIPPNDPNRRRAQERLNRFLKQ